MIDLLTPRLDARHDSGGLVLTPQVTLPTPARCVGDWLVAAAAQRPDATFLAEEGPDGWIPLSYVDALARVEGLGAALLRLGARPDRPVVILSDNSVRAATGSIVGSATSHPMITVSKPITAPPPTQYIEGMPCGFLLAHASGRWTPRPIA